MLSVQCISCSVSSPVARYLKTSPFHVSLEKGEQILNFPLYSNINKQMFILPLDFGLDPFKD